MLGRFFDWFNRTFERATDGYVRLSGAILRKSVLAFVVLIGFGAAGLWIENGELAYPVSEITIAGNLQQMLQDLQQVASNLEFRHSIESPAILIGEMTISGR